MASGQRRNGAAPPAVLSVLRLPQDFDAVTSSVGAEDIDDVIPLVTNSDELLALLSDVSSSGFEEVFIHSVSRDQLGFLRFMANEVFPHLRR